MRTYGRTGRRGAAHVASLCTPAAQATDKRAVASFISQARPREASGSVRGGGALFTAEFRASPPFDGTQATDPLHDRPALATILHLGRARTTPAAQPARVPLRPKGPRERHRTYFENVLQATRARSGRVNRTSTNNQRFTRKRRHAGANSSIYRYYVSTNERVCLSLLLLFLSSSSSSSASSSCRSSFPTPILETETNTGERVIVPRCRLSMASPSFAIYR